MNEAEIRLRQLQQIPVFALRQVVNKLIENENMGVLIHNRFHTALNRRPRKIKQAVQRLTREQLTKLIDICPEISDEQIGELFEEYRYGINPSFYIYLFDVTMLGQVTPAQFRQRFEIDVEAFNGAREEGLPRVRSLALNDLDYLPEQAQIIEGNYRFHSRLDYIDENQNAVSTYETLFGFFWFNMTEGYVIIQARNREILKALKHAIEQSASIYLTALVISKHLKNELLFRENLRSGRLHDPDPGPDRFRWLTIADNDPYAKGYQEWEERYPEVRSARYHEVVNEEKKTSLTMQCDQGALSLAGKLKASQFRTWCLDRLGKIIHVLKAFQANPTNYVQTYQLTSVPGMAKFNAIQKQHMVKIISLLLTLQQSPDLDYQPLTASPLDLAANMDQFVRVQIPLECSEPDCDKEGYLACSICEATVFRLRHQATTWQLECRKPRPPHWACALPFEGQCEQGHPFSLDEDDLAERIEVLPSDDLLQAIAGVVNHHLPGYNFDQERESFIIRGPNLIYYPDKAKVRDSERGGPVIHVNQQIVRVEDGKVIGVSIKNDN